MIKVPGDDKVYWSYSWREAKLLKINSKEAKYSVKAWENEKKIQKLQKEKVDIQKKLKAQIEKANHIRVGTIE
jgi:predicted thioesterase